MLFAGLAALLVLLVLPGAVSAASSDTVVVSGDIGGYIDVAVTSESLSLGTMVVGTPATASTTLTVSSSYATWGVDASDATNGGYMKNGAVALTNLFQINNGGAYDDLATPFTDFFTGSAGVGQTKPVNVQQSITAADASGTYSITVTFTGSSG